MSSITHIAIDESKAHGRNLKRGRALLAEALQILRDELNAMNTMIDTDPDPDSYAYLQTQYGIPSNGTDTGTDSNGYKVWNELSVLIGAFDSDVVPEGQAQAAAYMKSKINQFLYHLA